VRPTANFCWCGIPTSLNRTFPAVVQAVEAALADELIQETGLCVSGATQLHGIFFNSCVIARYHVTVYLCNATGKLPIKSPSLKIS
tara:strand:+ start:733 stop:990 length:258 start_codon:yes stop_codon:yes gene_type:complete